MAIDEVAGQPWTRQHDDPALPVVPRAPRTLYPKSLAELIEICSTRQPAEKIRAAGSHWSLSRAAISDSVFVETHDPNNRHQAMGRTLYDVVSVPGCLNAKFVDALAGVVVPPFDDDPNNVGMNQGLYPVHIETGKRVYQLYSELDWGDDNPRSLANYLDQTKNNSSYLGSWGFQTLGGAGGQTVFGALTTGTHGGDFLMPPIADAVMALHLVADGGRHYWIEPSSPTPLGTPLTDDAPLQALYGGLGSFEIIRDDGIFNAALVSAGRFGIVYSLVVAAVRQYCLHEERRMTTWQKIRSQIGDPTSDLYHEQVFYSEQNPPQQAPSPNRFLQIALSVTPHLNGGSHHAGVTKRWNVPLVVNPATGNPAGRMERRGERLKAFDAAIGAPRFEAAGNSFSYSPDPKRPGMARTPGMLERACSNPDLVIGVLDIVIEEIQDYIDSNGTDVGPNIASNTEDGTGLQKLIPALRVIVTLLVGLSLALRLLPGLGKTRLGHVMKHVKEILFLDPILRGAGIFVWHMIAAGVFSSQQGDHDYEAISYAVMDGHNYFDQGCNINVDSIEVFFNAEDPMLIAFIDALLEFEIGQEIEAGNAFVGYISMRFTQGTRALIGPQQFPLSCAVEVAGLRDATGVSPLIDFAIMLALDRNFKGILHWGQRNESRRAQVEERFGDTSDDQRGPLHVWRHALSRISQHGKLDGFSSAFTRQTGLEIVTPVITNLSAVRSSTVSTDEIVIDWNCEENPPATTVQLQVDTPIGTRLPFANLPLKGQQKVNIADYGIFGVSLIATLETEGEQREASSHIDVQIDNPIN